MFLTPSSTRALSRGLLDVFIRAGLVAVLVISCFKIFSPFLNLMLWSVILAITLYPVMRRIKGLLGNSDGRAATLIVLVSVIVLMVPIYLLGDSITRSVGHALDVVKEGSFRVPPPADSVANWPIVGKSLYGYWMQASTDLTGLAQKFAPQIKEITLVALGKLAGASMALLMFIAALIVAGIVMAYGENGRESAVRIASRIFGLERGEKITHLCTATIRAVAQGVIGIAFIQMLLIGVGFVLMGIPGAGLLSLAVLLLGIMQLPATLITVPVIAFVFITEGASVSTVLLSIYVFIAGLADNVLKPLLLGRGVDVPMPVVLIGALGGMVTGGIIGLFIGPVALAVGYQLFWQWVDDQPKVEQPDAQAPP
jgi:predicted PurR-regulated permease PerM